MKVLNGYGGKIEIYNLERVSVPNVTPSSKAVDVYVPAALKSSFELFGSENRLQI